MAGKSLKILILFLVLLVASCRTLPEGPYPDIIDWLPVESDVILRMEVPENTALVNMIIQNAGLDPEELSKIMDRTALVAVGLELEGFGTGNTIEAIPLHLASIGVWPKNLLGTALGKEWKKSVLGKHRWNGPGGLELKALSNNELLLSRGKTDVMLERLESGEVNPRIQRAADLHHGADLAIWVTDPEVILYSLPMLPASNPDGTEVIELIGLALKKVDSQHYALFLSIYPSDARLSGSLAFALRLGFSARFGMSSDPDERALMTDLHVEIGTGEVKVLLPSMSLEMLDNFLGEMKLFPEAEENES